MNVRTKLEKVEDVKSFLEFARALQLDKADEDRKEQENPTKYSHGHNRWQNNSIESYLESATAFVEDSDDWHKQENPWKQFALFLYGGKIYE